MAGRVRRRTYEILQIPSAPDDFWGRAFDVFIITLIGLNALAVVVETVPGIVDGYAEWFRAFELFSVVVFVAEYVLRLWSITANPAYTDPVTGRLRWMASPFAIIDVLAILPAFFLHLDLRFIRVLRVLRVLKLGRYSESVQILGNVVRRSRAEILTSLFLVGLALVLTSSFMYYAERDAQPDKFASIPHAMWWAIIALTTTGYGDVYPITTIGRLLGGFTALLGVMTIALPVGILSSSFVEEVQARRKRTSVTCPHCGKEVKNGKA